MAKAKKTAWDTLKWLAAAAGGMGSLLPGWAFFNDYAPPLFEAVSLVTGAVALAILVLAFQSKTSKRSGTRRALVCIIGAVFLLIGYGIARDLTTAPVPNYDGARLQVGFHLAAWSLTPDARQYVIDENIHLVGDLLLYTKYDQNAVELGWTLWSIHAASTMLIVLFTSAFLLWAYGFGLLARVLQK